VATVYLGASPDVLELERLEGNLRAARREDRELRAAAWRAERGRQEKLESLIIQKLDDANTPFRLAMTAGGYYLHRRQWRPMGKQRKEAAAVARAAMDQAEAVADVFLARARGVAGNAVLAELVETFSDDPSLREEIRRDHARWVRELAGPSPTAVEKVLAEAVALARLDAHRAALTCFGIMGKPRVSLEQEDYYQRRHSRALGRLMSACRTLETCRRLARPAAPAARPAPADSAACPLSAGGRTADAKGYGGRLAGVAGAGRN
jgi:hypothetical protein